MKRGSKGDHAGESFGQEIPGRIPESLIDAALDGQISDQMQAEIAHALQYDHGRRAELLETADAVRALDLDEIPMPDMQCVVLNRLDHQERFIPRKLRRSVRVGRMAVAAGVLLGLMLVAGMQSMYPRLTTIGVQSTPVHNVAVAVEEDAQRVATRVESKAQSVRASLAPLHGLLRSPSGTGGDVDGGGYSFSLSVNHPDIALGQGNGDLVVWAAGTGSAGQSQNQSQEICESASRKYREAFGYSDGHSGLLTLMSFGGQAGSNEFGRSMVVSLRGGRGFIVKSNRVEQESSSDDRLADLP